MPHLSLAVLAFLASHLVPAIPPLRSWLIARLGWRLYLGAYSALSLAVLGWVAVAYAQAPYVEVWSYDPALRWVPVCVMPLACVLLTAGLVRPNPLSVSLWPAGDGDASTDEATGGVGLFGVLRHPVPWAFALWAGAHAVPNGDAASLVLFGLLTLLSLGGMVGLDAKRRRVLGAERWRAMTRRRVRVSGAEALGVLAGLSLFAVLAILHAPVIGISPWPPALMGLTVGP